MPLIILKIGGSVITEKKNNAKKIKRKVLERLAKEVVGAKKKKNFSLIIIHGVGAFGHVAAKEFKLDQGYKNKKQITAISETCLDIKKLDLEVIKIFKKTGLNIVPFRPSSAWTLNNKRLENINVDIIKKYLSLDLIPVLHGDILIDNKNKFSVLSGDQIIYRLAKELKADRVIMGTDVDGVFDSNPKTNKKVTLYTVINKNNVKKIKVHETNSIDVTGGMGGKINELLQLAEVKIKSEIINITKEKILEKSLTNQKIVKTVIS